MIIDLEGDGLYPTKIHVLSWYGKSGVKSTSDYDVMRKILSSSKILIGHNIILYDVPVLERILDIKIEARLIDTLALSWYLRPNRIVHGLESYGEEYGIPKPKIDDWENLTTEEYQYRCEQDVLNNRRLWLDLRKELLTLYDTKKEADRLIDYLSFKMDTVREQERSRWKIDLPLINETLEKLEAEQLDKINKLTEVMPKVPVVVRKTRPEKPYKKDGSLSVIGAKWYHLLKEKGLPESTQGPIEVITSYEDPNPNSIPQVKSWLYSLGWKPQTYKFVKRINGSEDKVEQIRIDGEHGKELCPSVLKLADKEPAILLLEGLTIINHRMGILKGFLRDQRNGYLKATISGFTNTLRFKHKELVNLPGVDKPYGKEIRGSLVANDKYVLCGADMVSLEDTTKRHYMYPYDKSYVEAMSRDEFDPHLDLAYYAGAINDEELIGYRNKNKDFDYVKDIRTQYKTANYACIYGVGKAKLARELDITQKEAEKLISDYWKRNWSVKKLSSDQRTKSALGGMWLWNPVSGFWYSLRNDKDIFSTLNQSTGVYCFDTWVKHFRSRRSQITGQFHDEVILEIKEGAEEKCKKLLQQAIDKTNSELILNIQLGVDIKFGKTYAEIH